MRRARPSRHLCGVAAHLAVVPLLPVVLLLLLLLLLHLTS
jgi:hypothetical protein